MSENKIYLGDGAYATFQGHCIAVSAENGLDVASDVVYLEGDHLVKLFKFAKEKGLVE